MLPFDGFGYGKSYYWPNQIKSIGQKNGEYCSCWDNSDPVYLVEGTYLQDVKFKILCEKKKDICKTDFSKTEIEVSKLFREFYK